MPTSGTLRALLRVTVLPATVIVTLVVAWKSGYFDLDRRDYLLDAVQHLRLREGSVPAFLAGFSVAASMGLPTAILTILGGGLFGWPVGAALAWSGSLIGTALAHAVARRIARKPVERLLGRHDLLARIKDHDDIRTLVWIRLVPAAPFAVLPYVAGIAGVSLRRLVLATAMAIVPGTLIQAYLGAALIRRFVSPGSSSTALWIAAGVSILMPMTALVLRARTKR